MDIEAYILEAMRRSNKRPIDLVRETGISKATISRLLSGDRGMGLQIAQTLAKALDLEFVVRPKAKHRR